MWNAQESGMENLRMGAAKGLESRQVQFICDSVNHIPSVLVAYRRLQAGCYSQSWGPKFKVRTTMNARLTGIPSLVVAASFYAQSIIHPETDAKTRVTHMERTRVGYGRLENAEVPTLRSSTTRMRRVNHVPSAYVTTYQRLQA